MSLRRIRVRTAALATVIAAAPLAAAACASTQTGKALPMTGLAGASTASSSSPSGTASGLVGLNACSLLTETEAQQVVPGVGAHTDQADLGGSGTSDCEWTKQVTNGTGGVTFGITVRPHQGLSDIALKPGAQPSGMTSAAGRQVSQVKNNGTGFSCLAAIAVGSGRVDILATTLRGATTDQMCSIVSRIDGYVEARLPSS